jgi:hypothetical protein
LEAAVNVDIDDVGQIHRRRGYTRVAGGNFHSLYSDETGLVLAVKDNTLGVIYDNYVFEPLLPSAGSDPLDYVRVGETVYFSSAVASGKIGSDLVVSRWGEQVAPGTWLSPVVRPTSTLGMVKGKLISAPPMATALTYFNGRIYLANENVVWATELYLYDYVDKTKNFLQFESDITMLATVADGIYVGTKDAVWFLSGPFNEMKRIKLISYGALPRSAVDVPAELIKPQIEQDPQSPIRNAVMFMTNYGVCAGFDGGAIYNLTQAEVLLPTARTVAPMFRRQDGVNSYVAVTDCGGTPSANTRIGDYVDAEIVRFGNRVTVAASIGLGDHVEATIV